MRLFWCLSSIYWENVIGKVLPKARGLEKKSENRQIGEDVYGSKCSHLLPTMVYFIHMNLRFLFCGAFFIKLILVREYPCCRIQMYLILHCLYEGLSISLLFFYTFYSKGVEHLGFYLKRISTVWGTIFGEPANNSNLGKSTFTTLFYLHLYESLPTVF